MEAARHRKAEAVRLLLSKGAKVNIKDQNGSTALSSTGSEEVKKLLMDAGAK